MDFDINTAIDTLTKQRDDLVNNTTKKEINKINKKITIFKQLRNVTNQLITIQQLTILIM